MSTPLYHMDQLMKRIKNLQEFTIERELPSDFAFDGRVPYDMKISNGTAYIKVYAEDLDEANDKIDDFLIK